MGCFGRTCSGMPEALPATGTELSDVQIAIWSNQAVVVQSLIAKRLETAKQLRSPFVDPLPTTEPELTLETARRISVSLQRATDAARQLLDKPFVIVPLFQFHKPAQVAELSLAGAGPGIARASQVQDWMDSLSRVRPAVADAAWAIAVSSCMGAPIAEPIAIQLPRNAKAPWIGGKFTTPLPEGGWLAVISLQSALGFNGLQCGLVLDDWTENVPIDKATTGVSFHFNRLNAIAPQALLLAVPPAIRGHWDWEELKGCVHEAFDLAKLRAIEPDSLTTNGYFVGLPAILSEFSVNQFAHTLLTERSAAAAVLIKT